MEQKIVSKVIIEMMGNPADHVLNKLKEYINNLKEDNKKEAKILKEDYAEPKKVENENFYTTFVEIEIETKGLEPLVWICFDYRPSSIEIVEPENISYDARRFNEFFNDILGKLHHLDLGINKLDTQNKLTNKNAQILTSNFIFYILKNKPRTIKEIKIITGIDEKTIQTLLDKFVEQKIILKEDKLYKLNKT